MKISLTYFGDSILRKKTAEITIFDNKLNQLVDAMVIIMNEKNGIGLAAPQVNRSIALFITCIPVELPDKTLQPGNLKVYINPKILSTSSEKEIGEEGCLSIPGIYADISRPKEIKISAFDLNGKEFFDELSNLDARCFLHENDHLNGVLFVDRIPKKEKAFHKKKLKNRTAL